MIIHVTKIEANVDIDRGYKDLFGFFQGSKQDRREEIRLFQETIPKRCLSNLIIEEHILKD